MKLNMLIPAIIIIHMLCVANYMYDPELKHFHSAGWAVFFHATQSFFLFAIIILFIFIQEKTSFDNYYLLIWSVFNIILTIMYIAQYFKTVHRTYGFVIAVVSLAIILSMVLLNTIRYGYYNNK